jgi:hypothetical protein
LQRPFQHVLEVTVSRVFCEAALTAVASARQQLARDHRSFLFKLLTTVMSTKSGKDSKGTEKFDLCILVHDRSMLLANDAIVCMVAQPAVQAVTDKLWENALFDLNQVESALQ